MDTSRATASPADSGSNATRDDVVFSGTLTTTSSSTNALAVGGLVATATRSTFKDARCQSATINAPNSLYVGGIVGMTQERKSGTNQTSFYTTKKKKKHTISSVVGRNYVGGVAGWLDYGSSVHNMIASVDTITSKGAEAYAGAIVGCATEQNAIRNINLKFSLIEGSNYAGGIVGYSDSAPEIKNIISIGDMLSGTTVGGIMSVLTEKMALQNIYNDIQQISGQTAGGLFGKAEEGFTLNTVSNKIGKLDGTTVGAIAGSIQSTLPIIWTNVTSIARIVSNPTWSGLIFGSLSLQNTAQLTFNNTVIGGEAATNANYPLITGNGFASAQCADTNACFDAQNAFYFYKTAPTGNLDSKGELDSLFVPIHAIANGDSDKLSVILDVIAQLNAAFKMENDWKTENVTLYDDTTNYTFPVFRDYIDYVKDTFEDPDDEESGEN